MTHAIYLDNSTVTKPSEVAVSMMLPFLTEKWGSPSSPHKKGQSLYPEMEKSYQYIYEMLNANDTDTFVFTSSGAEAVNQVIFSTFYEVTRATGKNHFVTSNIDEAPAIMAMERLEALGCVSRMIEASPSGTVTAETIANSITPRTVLLSLSWANGLTGVVNPLQEISRLCQDRGILLHIDATHVLGKLFFDLASTGADFVTFNGSAIHAPQGTGGLLVRSGQKIIPFIAGGLEQAGHRSGDMNIPGLIALGEASKEATQNRDYMCMEIARLRDRLEQGIVQGYPEAVPFFQDQERVPHITAIGFPGIVNEALLFSLNRKGVYANIGGGSFQQISLVLQACGIEPTLAHSGISFSLSRYTTESEIDKAIEIIIETARSMRKLSSIIMPEVS